MIFLSSSWIVSAYLLQVLKPGVECGTIVLFKLTILNSVEVNKFRKKRIISKFVQHEEL